MNNRTFEDGAGGRWEAFATEAIVAHGRPGAALAFRPAGTGARGAIRTRLTFNSFAAADFALRTMADKELRRRLDLARTAAGS